MASKAKGANARGNNTGMIKNNNTVHPEPPSLGPVRYAAFQSPSEYKRPTPSNYVDSTGRPVSSMTLKPQNSGTNVNTRTAVNNGYGSEFNKGQDFAKSRKTQNSSYNPVI